jgi:hypothetical protein
MCRMSGGTKSMTKNKTEGLAAGKGFKHWGSAANTFKILKPICGMAGFKALWVFGGFLSFSQGVVLFQFFLQVFQVVGPVSFC